MEADSLGLGRLERIDDLRQIWPHEASAFTPWLARHIDVLGDAIGLPLTVLGEEVLVGEFRLDIHAVDLGGDTVIIENQLEPSDHAHLGQLLVYASGLDAATIVWVNTKLREEHRSALTWLNERTDANIRAFGLELGLVRIGDSAMAPTFDVVVQPNDWAKQTKQIANSGASELNQARMAFFERVFALVTAEYPTLRAPKARPENWLPFAAGPFGNYVLTFAYQSYRVDVWLNMGEQRLTNTVFDALYADRSALERALGFELTWERRDDKRSSLVTCYYPDHLDPLNDNEDALQAAARWSADRMIALHKNLDGTLRRLAKQVLAEGNG